MKHIYFLASFLFLQFSFSQILFNNGPLSTGTVSKSGVSAPAGYTWSELQNVTGNLNESNGIAGYPAYILDNGSASSIIADNFVVPIGQQWNVQGFDFYIFQPGYTGTTIPIDRLSLEIYGDVPFNAFGDFYVAGNLYSPTSNTLDVSNSSEAFMYRIQNSSVPTASVVPNTNNKIWKVRANLPVAISAGKYKVYFRCHGINDSMIFVPAVTLLNQRTALGWNAIFSDSAAGYFPVLDTGRPANASDVAQDIPFAIIGTSSTVLVNDFSYTATHISNYPISIVETNGAQATGSLIHAFCGSNAMNDGEWFSFFGSGGSITINLSDVQSNYDPQIGVYSGYSNTLNCIGTVDDGGTASPETFTIPTTVLGNLYHINIGHFDGGVNLPEGNFTLNISSSKLINDTCQYAVPIPSLPYTFTRTNGNVTTNTDGFALICPNGMNDGEWYKFSGTGGQVTLAITNVALNYDPQIAVYSGINCSSLDCVTTTDIGNSGDNETIVIPSTVIGTEYYINIANYSANVDNPEGNFTITVASPNLETGTFSKSNFKVYPNPVHDFLNIESDTTINKVAIYNLLGQEVFLKTTENITKIDLSELPKGTYIARLLSDKNDEKTIKIIKN